MRVYFYAQADCAGKVLGFELNGNHVSVKFIRYGERVKEKTKKEMVLEVLRSAERAMTAGEIVEKSDKSEKILGYMFIHIFKGAHLKRKLTNIPTRPIKIEGDLRTIYFFIFLGSRGEINYLKREIELQAPKFDPSILDLEIEENLSFRRR